MNADETTALARLVASWRADEKVARECAASHHLVGNWASYQQLKAQADGLKRCADDLERAMAQQITA